MSDCSTSSSINLPHCIWCGYQKKMADGKKFCFDCQRACKQECVTCHKPYPNEKKYFTMDAKRCDSCTTRFKNAKLSRKKNKKLVKMRIHDIDSAEDADDEVGGKNDDDDEDIVFKKKKKRKAKPLSESEGEEEDEEPEGNNDAHSVASSEVLTISDNNSVQEAVDEVEEYEGARGNKVPPKKKAAISPESQPMKTVFDQMMEQAGEKKVPKKHTPGTRKKGEGKEGKKRVYRKKSPQEKSPIQAEKDLIRALSNYKKASPHNTQITIVFVPTD